MRITSTLLLSTIMVYSGTALANTSMAENCLAYGKKVMKDSPKVLLILNQAIIDKDHAFENKYDEKVGSQYISTELVADIHSQQEKLGSILCLFDQKPLYFKYQPAE